MHNSSHSNTPNSKSGCLVCGKNLVYTETAQEHTCYLCGQSFYSNAVCEDGHYICDKCHSLGSIGFFVALLMKSEEKDPHKLLDSIFSLPEVHMHGPEHHMILPCVLLTAYRNNGGKINLKAALKEAVKRGSNVPGGTCGFFGACGASVGAGIYISILTGATPMTKEQWGAPQDIVAKCLSKNVEYGGPRCCKRTCRTAVDEAIAFTEKNFGISMPHSAPVCEYFKENKECIGTDCPYFPSKRDKM